MLTDVLSPSPAVPRFNKADTTNVTAFPDGLRMLTGNPFKRSYDGSEAAQAIGWNCLGADVAETRIPTLPKYNCPNGLRGEIRFPSCWNGVDLDSADHSSHVAYPIGGESGRESRVLRCSDLVLSAAALTDSR